jgi:hypothetical protein
MTRQHAFTHNGVTITVHIATGEDELDAEVMEWTLDPTLFDDQGNPIPKAAFSVSEKYKDQMFVKIVTQTDSIEGDIGFTLPPRTADADTLKAARAALLATTGGLLKRWIREIENANRPPGDPILTPEAVAAPKKAAK